MCKAADTAQPSVSRQSSTCCPVTMRAMPIGTHSSAEAQV